MAIKVNGTTVIDDSRNISNVGTIDGTSFNSITGLSSTTPAPDGVAAVGTATTAARADHVHAAPTTVSGNAGTATSLAGGTAGAVPYQSGAGASAFTAVGTAGQVLTSQGTGAPTWTTPAGGASSAQVVASNGFFVNSKTVAASYSIPAGSNAMSTGPITVASGQSVTVPSGSRWVIL